MKAIRTGIILAAVAAAGVTYLPQTASACGGFFCQQTPIDQSAERIIFAQRGGTITAYIQVAYSGSAEDFSWVVPVSAVPEIDVTDSTIFQSLDQATGVVITPPSCLFDFGGGMAEDADGNAAPGSSGGGARGDEVVVYSEATVGPYDTAVVGSENADMLIDWLNERDYIITEAMRPIVEQYVSDGLLFMAMRLSADQGVDALRPIVMTYEGSNPVIPIRLTAVAAEPNMGIIVWLLGEGRAVSANFANITVDTDRIRFDSALNSNYRTVVSQSVDEYDGGHAFVTEYADRTENVSVFDEETRALLDQYDWLTRMYTTLSPEEMTLDPVFSFNPNMPAVSNVIDLSSRDDLCATPPSPCDFNHCGAGATCYEVNGAAACECGDGFVARGVSDPVRGAAVTCTPEDRDMIGDLVGDPCASVTCGEFGACIAINGVATCACDAGYIATNRADGSVECADVDLAELPDPTVGGGGPTFGDTPAGDESAGCQQAGGSPGPAAALLFAALGAFALLRRRQAVRA
jgi:MYXO-CTERM domain-containing protein